MRRLLQGFVAAVLFATVIGCLPLSPGAVYSQKCPGALYCPSSSVPQNVSGGTCCVTAEYANASVGSLCAFGANYQPAGCVNSVEGARKICPNAVAIVRCVAE